MLIKNFTISVHPSNFFPAYIKSVWKKSRYAMGKKRYKNTVYTCAKMFCIPLYFQTLELGQKNKTSRLNSETSHRIKDSDIWECVWRESEREREILSYRKKRYWLIRLCVKRRRVRERKWESEREIDRKKILI